MTQLLQLRKESLKMKTAGLKNYMKEDHRSYRRNFAVAKRKPENENCGVKNYMKEDHRSYRRNFCICEKKA